MATISIDTTTSTATATTAATTSAATSGRVARARAGLRAVPWTTVLPLAAVMAYADGFWMISLRGAVGAIERTQGPFGAWVRESTLALPIFALAVLGALTLAARWFGPTLARPRALLGAVLLVVAAGTIVGVGALAASSAYDFHLQAAQAQLMGGMPGMPEMGPPAQLFHATLNLQLRSVAYGSALLLLTNLILAGWVLALKGGRLTTTKTHRP
jgi:hypothetical protein